MQAKIIYPAFSPAISAGYGQVTLHTRLVFLPKIRQPFLKIVALAAFFLSRGTEQRPVVLTFTGYLIMRVMAVDAQVQTMPAGFFPAGVAAFGDLLQNRFMTGRALFDLKKIHQASVDINRIRMAPSTSDIVVAVLTGQLSVDGYMIALVVDQPRSLRSIGQAQKGNHRNYSNYEIFPDRHH